MSLFVLIGIALVIISGLLFTLVFEGILWIIEIFIREE